MKKHLYLFLLLLCVSILSFAQNLVPNPSFETFSPCPNSQNQVHRAPPWMNPSLGTNVATMGSPDYFNACATMYVDVPNNPCGDQFARTGNAYCGIHLWCGSPNPDSVREYIEAPLNSPLVAGSCYHFEMYYSQADYYRYTSDKIGVYFSDTAVTGVPNFFPLPFVPQIQNTSGNFPDTTNWVLVSGDYISEGGESYIIIGNFLDDAHTDSVMLNPAAPVRAAYVYIDDVSLVLTAPCNATAVGEGDAAKIKVYPNPAADRLNVSVPSGEAAEVLIWDMTGRVILRHTFAVFATLDIAHFSSGIYLYEVRSTVSGLLRQGKFVKE